MLKTISDQSFLDLKAKGWRVSTNPQGFVCSKNQEPTGPAFDSAQEAWVYAESEDEKERAKKYVDHCVKGLERAEKDASRWTVGSVLWRQETECARGCLDFARGWYARTLGMR